MRQYELMVILSPEIEERTVAPALEKVLSVVTDNGGSIEKLDVWGKRRLAYPIEKKTEGLYVVVNMTTTPEHASEVDRQLRLNESVMRTKLIRPDAH